MDIPYIATLLPSCKSNAISLILSVVSKRKNHSLVKRLAIDIAGFGLIIISPFLGWLPGPGGIPIFLAGLGILSLNYDWAENLLKDFEKKRVEFTDKYLMTDKKTSRIIDTLSILIIVAGIIAVVYIDNFILRLLSFGALTLGVLILISNQKRIDRIVSKFKSKSNQKHKH